MVGINKIAFQSFVVMQSIQSLSILWPYVIVEEKHSEGSSPN